MGDGLKQVWGLDDAKAPPSTAQADQFKASYQAILNAVNTALQYTVTNAEKPKHDEKASERDELNSTYQAVIVKIDPSNAGAAESAINAALEKVKSAGQAIGAFKADVEKDVAAWAAKEPSFTKAMSMIDELEVWGHKMADTLRAIVKKIQEQVNNKVLKPAIQAVVELLQKLQPIYDEYLKQKAAKEKYDPAIAALKPKMPTECRFQKLAPQLEELNAIQGQMESLANEKDYVSALEQEEELSTKLDAYLAAVDEIERQKKAYEDALATLQPNLTKATGAPQHQKLADKRTEIDTQKGEMEESAKNDEYEQALQKAGDLSTKVDDYLAAVEELEKQKKAYEEALEKLQPNLAKATAAPQHEKLADKRSEIDSAKSDMESAAQEEDYEKALAKAGDLSTKVDNYLSAVDELEKQKKQYEDGLAALQPKLQQASKSEHEKLQPIQAEMLAIQNDMEKAAQSEDYEQALKLQGDLSAKADEYALALAALQKQKDDYEQGLAALQPKLTDASNSKAQFADLQPIQADMAKIQGDMEAAAKADDYEKALLLLADLGAKVQEYFAAIEKKKAEYETARKAAQSKIDDCMVSARDFPSIPALVTKKTAVTDAEAAMAAAAKVEDYDKAKQAADDAVAKADAYLADAKKEQEKYDKKGEDIKKQLDGASDATRGDVAKAAAKALTPDEVAHLPSDIRNRLLTEIQKGGLTDDAKTACKVLFSKQYLDPEFEKMDMENRRKLIEKMKNDPAFKDAREHWADYTEEKRIAIMQKAVDYEAETYGIPKTTIETYHKDDPKDFGYYKHADGKLHVNGHDSALKNGGFDEAIDTAVHENAHRLQSTMVDQLSPPPTPPKIKPGDPQYNQAMQFKLNESVRGFYVQPRRKTDTPTASNGPEYFTQPRENHARQTGQAVQDAQIGT